MSLCPAIDRKILLLPSSGHNRKKRSASAPCTFIMEITYTTVCESFWEYFPSNLFAGWSFYCIGDLVASWKVYFGSCSTSLTGSQDITSIVYVRNYYYYVCFYIIFILRDSHTYSVFQSMSCFCSPQ